MSGLKQGWIAAKQVQRQKRKHYRIPRGNGRYWLIDRTDTNGFVVLYQPEKRKKDAGGPLSIPVLYRSDDLGYRCYLRDPLPK